MPSQNQRRIISFELPVNAFKALQQDAELRGTASGHQRARELVVEYFSNPDVQQLKERVEEIDREIAYLGEMLRRTTFSVMVHAGKLRSEDANEWIREHMPRTRS